MYLDKILVATVKHLRSELAELRDEEIQVSPEGRPWPSTGQKFLAVHATAYSKINAVTDPIKKYRIRMAITYNLRVRDIPVDRLALPAYLDSFTSLTNILEKCILNIDQSTSYHSVLLQELPDTCYLIGKTTLTYMDPDPTHLSPPYFESDDMSSERIAGYKMTAYFDLPKLIVPPTEECP